MMGRLYWSNTDLAAPSTRSPCANRLLEYQLKKNLPVRVVGLGWVGCVCVCVCVRRLRGSYSRTNPVMQVYHSLFGVHKSQVTESELDK